MRQTPLAASYVGGRVRQKPHKPHVMLEVCVCQAPVAACAKPQWPRVMLEVRVRQTRLAVS